jgi:NhaA family Na+:H+ antiporter
MIIGLILWVCVLKSGVHATLAGVTLAFCIPTAYQKRRTLAAADPGTRAASVGGLRHPAAVRLRQRRLSLAASPESFTHVPMGIAVGLLLGKTVGVFGLTWLA